MAFAGHCGITIAIDGLVGDDALTVLLNEELGAVIQVTTAQLEAVKQVLAQHGLSDNIHHVGSVQTGDRFVRLSRIARHCTARVAIRCALGERRPIGRCSVCVITQRVPIRNTRISRISKILALNVKLTFAPQEYIAAPYIATGVRPKVVVLHKKQGVISHVEMAAAVFPIALVLMRWMYT